MQASPRRGTWRQHSEVTCCCSSTRLTAADHTLRRFIGTDPKFRTYRVLRASTLGIVVMDLCRYLSSLVLGPLGPLNGRCRPLCDTWWICFGSLYISHSWHIAYDGEAVGTVGSVRHRNHRILPVLGVREAFYQLGQRDHRVKVFGPRYH